MIRWFFVNTIIKLDKAEEVLNRESQKQLNGIIDVDKEGFSVSLERKAAKAGIWLWVARIATNLAEVVKKYKQLTSS